VVSAALAVGGGFAHGHARESLIALGESIAIIGAMLSGVEHITASAVAAFAGSVALWWLRAVLAEHGPRRFSSWPSRACRGLPAARNFTIYTKIEIIYVITGAVGA